MKSTIKSIKLLLFLIIVSQNVHGQFAFNNIEPKLKNPPLTSYKIIQTEKGEIKKILEFDNNGRIIFDYRESENQPFLKWKEPHRFIYSHEYDTNGRIVNDYNFNSNAGLSIYSYEYKANPLSKTMYKQKFTNPKEVKINSNPYAFISKFTNFNELKKSDEVANINSSTKTKSYIEFLNLDNKPIERKEYSRMHSDTIITSFEYNLKGEEILKKVVVLSTNETDREVRSKHKEDSEITEIVNFRDGEETSIYRFAESNNQTENTKTKYSERKGEMEIRHNVFDKDGYLINIIVFEAEFKGDLIIPISPNLRKTSEMIYEYNKDGLLVKEIMNNYKTGKKDTRKYKYCIEISK